MKHDFFIMCERGAVKIILQDDEENVFEGDAVLIEVVKNEIAMCSDHYCIPLNPERVSPQKLYDWFKRDGFELLPSPEFLMSKEDE